MYIASKINAALFGAFACATLASFAVLHSTIQPKFEDIERSAALVNHKRVIDAFEAATEKLQTATQDYAYWDETYDALQGINTEAFILSNLSPGLTAVENLAVNLLVFQKSDGTVFWGGAVDLETKEPIDGLVNEIAHFVRSHRYLDGAYAVTKRGLIRTSKGLLFVAISPSLKSDRSGEPVGKIISGKLLDDSAIRQLTGVSFSLEALPEAFGSVSLPEDVDLRSLDTVVQTTSVVKNVIGRPLVYLKVSSPRDVSSAGAMAIHSAMLMMILAALTSMGVLWAFLRLTIVSRIAGLKTHFATAGSSGHIRPTEVGTGGDEISDLSQSFNAMACQVNDLRNALADSAYMSGLSEWAAGTLHNVRNGLVPVTATTWQVEQLYDAAWVRNVEAATVEHADSATPPERRVKLNKFLVGSAARLVEAAKKTTHLTGRINDASRSIIDMVSEFERHAHRKLEMEGVDLLPLIKTSAAASIAARSKTITLGLPSSSAVVTCNSIILRQIISNVLINAAEAIEAQQGPGRIDVTITHDAGREGFARVEISDTGEGLSPERLADIFKRGVSTRHHRTGGLGLHWCANAINVLGGTIRAASDGLGRGATIIIELPEFNSITKEAA